MLPAPRPPPAQHRPSQEGLRIGRLARAPAASAYLRHALPPSRAPSWPPPHTSCRVEPAEFRRYDMFLPVLECPAAHGGMRRLGGDGDGGKWLCMAERLRHKAGCVIYSIGSLGNYDFELAMLELGAARQPGWLAGAPGQQGACAAALEPHPVRPTAPPSGTPTAPCRPPLVRFTRLTARGTARRSTRAATSTTRSGAAAGGAAASRCCPTPPHLPSLLVLPAAATAAPVWPRACARPNCPQRGRHHGGAAVRQGLAALHDAGGHHRPERAQRGGPAQGGRAGAVRR